MTEGVKRDALLALEKRVAEAKGPDRQIDALLCELLEPDVWAFCERQAEGWGGITPGSISPKYTASIDRSLALVSRVLPGAEYEITTLYGPAHVQLPLNGDNRSDGRREDGNVPLAILLALLRSLTKGAGG